MKQTKNSDIQATVFIPASMIQKQAIVSATEFSRYIWTMIVETETDQLQAFSYACTFSHRELHIYFIRNYADFFFLLHFSKFLQHLQFGHTCCKQASLGKTK